MGASSRTYDGGFQPNRRTPHVLENKTIYKARTTRSGARSLVVNSVACAMAVRVVDEVEVEVDDAEAADRTRRAMER